MRAPYNKPSPSRVCLDCAKARPRQHCFSLAPGLAAATKRGSEDPKGCQCHNRLGKGAVLHQARVWYASVRWRPWRSATRKSSQLSLCCDASRHRISMHMSRVPCSINAKLLDQAFSPRISLVVTSSFRLRLLTSHLRG